METVEQTEEQTTGLEDSLEPEGQEPEGAEEETVEETEEQEQAEEKTPEEIKYSKAVQKRINEIVHKKNEALKKVDELQAQLDSRNTGRPIRPSIEKFSNEYGEINQHAYDSALSDYEDQFFDWKQKTMQEKENAARIQSQAEAQKEKFLALAEDIRQTHPDFDEVIERPVFSRQLSQALFEIEKGAELAYYLGTHEDDALRIGQLSPVSMVKELNMLLGEKFKKSTTAPEPIEPIAGAKTGRQKKWSEMSDEEWFRHRERERLKKLKGG